MQISRRKGMLAGIAALCGAGASRVSESKEISFPAASVQRTGPIDAKQPFLNTLPGYDENMIQVPAFGPSGWEWITVRKAE